MPETALVMPLRTPVRPPLLEELVPEPPSGLFVFVVFVFVIVLVFVFVTLEPVAACAMPTVQANDTHNIKPRETRRRLEVFMVATKSECSIGEGFHIIAEKLVGWLSMLELLGE